VASWSEMAPALGLEHSPFEVRSALHQGIMEGSYRGRPVRVWQIDRTRQSSRTGISMDLPDGPGEGLSIRASASERSGAHWGWAALAGIFFAGGAAGAIAGGHPGPLALWVGGGLVLWGYLSARKSAARRAASGAPTGDGELDRLLSIEAVDPARAVAAIREGPVRGALLRLASGDRELALRGDRILLEVGRVIGSKGDFREILDDMALVADRLARLGAG